MSSFLDPQLLQVWVVSQVYNARHEFPPIEQTFSQIRKILILIWKDYTYIFYLFCSFKQLSLWCVYVGGVLMPWCPLANPTSNKWLKQLFLFLPNVVPEEVSKVHILPSLSPCPLWIRCELSATLPEPAMLHTMMKVKLKASPQVNAFPFKLPCLWCLFTTEEQWLKWRWKHPQSKEFWADSHPCLEKYS